MSSPAEWVNAKQAAGEHQIKHAALFDAEVRPRPEGRIVMLVWQGRDRNEWSTAINRALAGETGAAAPGPDSSARGPDPFALGDPARAEEILAAAGFAEVGFTDVDEPIYYGPDPSVAYDFVLGLRDPKDVLARMDAETAEHARDRLRATLEEHATRDGVFFGSRAWIITARRPGTPRYLPP